MHLPQLGLALRKRSKFLLIVLNLYIVVLRNLHKVVEIVKGVL